MKNKRGDLRRNEYLWIFVIVVVIAGALIYFNLFNISTGIKESGELVVENTQKINEVVGKLNINLEAIEKIPNEVDAIKNKITSVNEKIGKIDSDTTQLKETEIFLKDNVNKLNGGLTSFNQQIGEFNRNVLILKELQEKYPPVQTQQLIFENVSHQEVNQAIQTAITSNSKSYGLYFSFGSLFGSLFSISLYFIWQFYNKKKSNGGRTE
jgi:predicted nuclease with TOPRIM domain